MNTPFVDVIERWARLAGVKVQDVARYLETGEPAALAAACPAANVGLEVWLLEDLLEALPDPPSFGEADRRLLRLLSALEQQGGRPVGQEPHVLVGRWLERRLRREPAGEDWFGAVGASLELSPALLARVAALSQAGSRPALTSAGRHLLSCGGEELGPIVAAFRGGYGTVAPIVWLLARHAPERLGWAARILWPRLGAHELSPLLALLLAAHRPDCTALAAAFCEEHGDPAAEAELGWRLPGRPSSRERIGRVLVELRRYRRLDETVLDRLSAYLASGERSLLEGLPAVPPRSGLVVGPFDELGQTLSPPSHLAEEDGRLLEVLIKARAHAVLVHWVERAAAAERADEDGFALASEALLRRGLEVEDLRRALGQRATRFTGLRGPTSLGRYLLSLPEDELCLLAAESLDARMGGALLAFLVEEAPLRFLREVRPALLAEASVMRAHGLVMMDLRLLELHPGLAEAETAVAELAGDPARLLAAGERSAPHLAHQPRGFQLELLRGLVALHRDRYLERGRELARTMATDPQEPRRGEAARWLVRTCGGEVLEALQGAIAAGPDQVAEPLAIFLAEAFGRHGLAAARWLLERSAPYQQILALRYLVQARDPLLDETIERELGRLLEAGDVRTQVQCLGVAAGWSFSRVEAWFWRLLQGKSKQVRYRAARELGARLGADAFERAAGLLAHKQAAARLGAVTLLALLGDARTGSLLEDRLDAEPSEEVRDELLLALRQRWASEGRAPTLADVERRIARTRLRDDLAPWLDLAALPPLFFSADGSPLPRRAVHYLLHRQARVRGVRPDLEAEALYALIDRSRSGDFALALLESFLGAGAATEEGWALTVAGILGDERVVHRLVGGAAAWIRDHRVVFAEYAVRALALQGSDAALQAVDAMALRYATKPKNVGEAAAEAFAEAAERQDLTMDALRDRVVPWLGFEPGKPRLVACGSKTVEVRINPDFAVAFRDLKTGKPVRSLPQTAPPEVALELKELKPLLKEAARAQSLRLENLLVVGHRWSAEVFRERFLGHPLLFPFAVRLVWGAHDPSGALLLTFRARGAGGAIPENGGAGVAIPENGVLVDAEGAAVAIPESAGVGMIHPLEVPVEVVAAWRDRLAADGIEPPFAQLDRPVFRLPPEQRDMNAYCGLLGTEVDPGHVKRVAERLAWRRGDVSGGMIGDYWKAFPLTGLVARIALEDMPVVLDLRSSARFRELVFVRRESRQRLQLGEVPELVLSETLSELQKISNRPLTPAAG